MGCMGKENNTSPSLHSTFIAVMPRAVSMVVRRLGDDSTTGVLLATWVDLGAERSWRPSSSIGDGLGNGFAVDLVFSNIFSEAIIITAYENPN